nr:hypothetical protein [Mycobacterium sp. E3298]
MGGKPEFVKELEAKGIRGMAAVRYMMNEYKTNNQQLPGEKIYE